MIYWVWQIILFQIRIQPIIVTNFFVKKIAGAANILSEMDQFFDMDDDEFREFWEQSNNQA